MTDASIPAPLPWRASRAKTDIFSAIIRASKEFGGKTVAIVDGDGTEVDYKTILRGSFALGSALGKKIQQGRNGRDHASDRRRRRDRVLRRTRVWTVARYAELHGGVGEH